MPDPNDESATIAMTLVMDVRDLLTMVDNRRFYDADEVAQRLRRSLDDIDRRLIMLRRGLSHDLDPRGGGRREEPEGGSGNPYRRGTTRGSTESEGLASLSDEDLMEHTRYYYWRYHHETVGFQRWNLFKRYSAAQDAVTARGYGPLAWMDGMDGMEGIDGSGAAPS